MDIRGKRRNKIMVEKKEVVIKLLNKNYGSVQDKENKVAELNDKLAKDFSSNALEISKILKKELRDQKTLDKDVQTKYAKLLKELKAEHATHLKDIDSKHKQFNDDYQKALKLSSEKHASNVLIIENLIVEIKENNEKNNDNTDTHTFYTYSIWV